MDRNVRAGRVGRARPVGTGYAVTMRSHLRLKRRRSFLRPLALLVAIAGLSACGASGTTPAPSTTASMAMPTGSGGPAASAPAAVQGFGPGCGAASPPATLPAEWTHAPATPKVIPEIVSSQLACGPTRVVFSFIDSDNRPIAAPDRTARVAFFDLGRDSSTPAFSGDGTFIWLIEGQTGIYVVNVEFPESGEWGALFTTAAPGGPPEEVRLRFEVQPMSYTPVLGSTAPSVRTPTLADVGGDVRQISSDRTPDPRFYQLSEDQALAQHKPFVLVFATPAFCTSRVCGPTLDRVKAFAKAYPDLAFINVEPYRLTFAKGLLQPTLDANGQLQATDATNAWRILSEPWIFVVDGAGIVRGTFESVAADAELAAAIGAATK